MSVSKAFAGLTSDLRRIRSKDMPRLPRSHLPAEGIYHVTAHGTGSRPIFVTDLDRLDFLDLLGRASKIAGWECHAWCLMTTHYHLVLETSLTRLSRAMHRLNTAYAQRFNRRHERRGHLFDSRFSAWVVRDDAHFEATCRYVLDNPVRAGLSTPDEPVALGGTHRLGHREQPTYFLV
jgi:REP element-mobilizing transposase RayT